MSWSRWLSLAVAVGILGSVPASARPYLLGNLATSAPTQGASASGPGLPTFRGVIFPLATPEEGVSLWVSDGTRAGTHLLIDNPPGRSVAPPELLASTGQQAYFAAFDGEGSYQLWITNGTTAGTRALTRLDNWAASGRQDFALDPLTGKLYFSIGDREQPGPWVSNGTVGGTFALATVEPEVAAGSSTCLAASEGKAFFLSQLDDDLMHFWVTDGTAAGTRRLAEFPASPGSLFDLGGGGCIEAGRGLALFRARTPAHGTEVWVTDGTRRGTRLLLDFAPGPASSEVYPVTAVAGGFLLRSLDDRLWWSDGTGEGTVLLAEGIELWNVREATAEGGGRFTFLVRTPDAGPELWISNRTRAGTRPLIRSCATCDLDAHRSADDRALFVQLSDRETLERRAWLADAASATVLEITSSAVEDCVPLFQITPEEGGWLGQALDSMLQPRTCRVRGASASIDVVREVEEGRNHAILPVRGRGVLLLESRPSSRVRDDLLQLVALGRHQREGDVVWAQAPRDAGSNPHSPLALGDAVWFVAERRESASPYPDPSAGVWVSNAAGTRPVLTAPQAELWRYIFGPHRAGELLFYAFEVNLGFSLVNRLVAVDTRTGTGLTLIEHRDFVACESFAAAGGLFYSVADSFLGARWLWFSDGTAEGTVEVGLLDPFSCGNGNGIELGGAGLFVAADHNLWSSDGTPAGTQRVAVLPEDVSESGAMVRAGDLVFFLVRLAEGYQLWRTDGTADGTWPLAIPLLRGAGPDLEAAAVGDVLYFRWRTEELGTELWRSDGTDAGTRLVRDIRPGPTGSGPRALTAVGSRIFFSADDGIRGAELWTTDGTRQGTRLLADLHPGPASSGIGETAAVAGQLVFQASNGVQGMEAWASDGTERGTRLLTDLRPGPHSSDPRSFTPAGDRIFFAASDGEIGWEPWALPRADLQPGCDPEDRELCLLGGRVEVKVRFREPATGLEARATPVPFSDLSGFFWFFDDSNIELVVKVLDGRAITGAFWTFYGALSDVEYWVEVTDTVTGATKSYYNPAGQICGVGDVGSLPADNPLLVPAGDDPLAPVPTKVEGGPPRDAGRCSAVADTLCLLGRFAVEVDWRNHRTGETGIGSPVTGASDTDRSGALTFFDPANVELVVKMLDGRAENGRFWVFYGALSDVEYTLRITDTETGDTQTYVNPAGNLCGRADVNAFPPFHG